LVFASVLLSYAAWSDLSKREVENWVSVVLVAGGFAFAAYDSFATGEILPLVLTLASASIGFVMALAIFYAGSMGGADCKIFIGISAMFPIILGEPLPMLSTVNPFVEGGRRLLPMFSISWLVNSLFISLVVPIGLFLKNTVDYARGRISGVGRGTLPAFFVGYRTKVRNLRPSFVIPLERFEDDKGGGIVRVMKYSRKVLDEEEEKEIISKVRDNLQGDDPIWAFPYIPFIVPMLAGFFTTILLGDLLVNLLLGL
jgi:prepilin signal peptidase PulO-like enzyme (type II secretory pathway)